jgi:hypothetical protein
MELHEVIKSSHRNQGVGMQTINHSEMAKYYMDKNGKNSPMASPSYKMVNATPRIRNLIMKTGGEPFSF